MLNTQFTRFSLDSEDLDIINSTQNSLNVQNIFRRQSLPQYQTITRFIIFQFVQMKSASPIARDTNVSPLPLPQILNRRYTNGSNPHDLQQKFCC